MTPATGPVTPLNTAEAWAELRSHGFGRLAVSIGGEPDIFPVNFVEDGGALVFLTAEGTKLLAATVEGCAALEVDRVEPHGATSVVVRGTLREITDPEAVRHAAELPLTPWVPTYKTHYLSLMVTSIAGRSFAFGAAPTEARQDG